MGETLKPEGRGLVKTGEQTHHLTPPDDRLYTYQPDPEAINAREWFHGTGTPNLTADTLDSGGTNIANLFGQGVYLTDRRSVAAGYARNRSHRTGTPTIYKASVDLRRVLDLEAPVDPVFHRLLTDRAHSITASTGLGEFAENFPVDLDREASKPGATNESLYLAFSEGVTDFSHANEIPTSELWQDFQELASDLRASGYDALTHVGGKRVGTKQKRHQVVIVLDPSDLGATDAQRRALVTAFDPEPSGILTVGQYAPSAPSPPPIVGDDLAETEAIRRRLSESYRRLRASPPEPATTPALGTTSPTWPMAAPAASPVPAAAVPVAAPAMLTSGAPVALLEPAAPPVVEGLVAPVAPAVAPPLQSDAAPGADGARTSPPLLRIGAVLAGLLLAGFALLIVCMIVVLSTSGDSETAGAFDPSAAAVADIPATILPLYLDAGAAEGIDWAILAGIGKIETDHGRSNAPGVRSGVNAYGCCAGPMQFSVVGPGGGTWGAYGTDGNHDGQVSVYDPADAIPAAARYLKASGAPGDYKRAIFAYNHAAWYVAQVEQWASKYRGALADAGGQPAQLTANIAGASQVLALSGGPHPRITLTASQRNDLSTGQIDPRVTSILAAIARAHTIAVTSLKGDHGYTTTSGNVSNHSAGRAADIGVVDDVACNSVRQGRSGPCWALARELAALKGPLHPTELIYGIDPDGPGPAFACTGAASCGGNHTDHVHVGYDG